MPRREDMLDLALVVVVLVIVSVAIIFGVILLEPR